MLERREFLGGLTAAGVVAAFAPQAFAAAGRGPRLFSMGILTDTHIGSYYTKGTERLVAAMELFRREKADFIVNVGDICDRHDPAFYAAYRQAVDGVFPPDRPHPRELYVYAWHDAFAYKGHARDRSMQDQVEAFADVRRYLRAENPPNFQTVVKGIPVLVFQQYFDAKEVDYEGLIAKAEAEHPGKPVLVFDHQPLADTVDRTEMGGADGSFSRREILNRHPRVIHISGHIHGSLRNERNIWQGEFTAVNAGCLQVWGNDPVRHEYGVIVMDVHEKAVVFRRFDVRDGTEIGADSRWIVPLPFDSATAPYRSDCRRRTESVAEFPATARAEAAFEKGRLVLGFPEARGKGPAFKYEIACAGLFERTIYGDFSLREADRTGRARFSCSAAYFDPGVRYDVTVTPVGFFGGRGRPLVVPVERPTPEEGAVVRYDCRNPMEELKLKIGTTDGDYAVRDGAFVAGGRMVGRLILPKAATDVKVGERLCVIADLRTTTQEGEVFRTNVAGAVKPDWTACTSCQQVASGRPNRVVCEFKRDARSDELCIYIHLAGRGPCAVRFERVRIIGFGSNEHLKTKGGNT